MRYFCTYFDHNYLARGLALHRSLRHCKEFRLFVLCMDEEARDTMRSLDLAGVELISLAGLEQSDPELHATRKERSTIEYYFTATPCLPLFVLNKWAEVDMITYIDADLFFYSSPEPLFDELAHGSVGIIAHRFPPRLKERERYGLYNVGWLSFRRDEAGLDCIRWWRERCIEWCYDREEDGRFADQKYLDDWPARFEGVVVLQHPGANVAPWNLDRDKIEVRGGKVTIESKPLIFFHFHNLKQIAKWLYDPAWKEYGVAGSVVLRDNVYLPYIRTLRMVSRMLPHDADRKNVSASSRTANGGSQTESPLRRLVSRLRTTRDVGREIAEGTLIVSLPFPGDDAA